ncbi:MAG: hypothetical protein Q8O84_02410 [Nanoarchaeota archaeon]|nr:hypothetical protein [Nanoarchaeota archaeon]
MAKKQEDKFGLVSLILGIVSVLFMLIGFAVSFVGFFGFILMILTFIFSGIQLKRNKNNFAMAGLILAFIALVIFLFDATFTASVARDIAYEKCLNQYDDPTIAQFVCKK